MLDCDNNIVILWRFYVSSDRKTITQVDFEISYRPSTLSRFIKLADVVSNYHQLCFLKVQTTIGHNKIKIHRTAWVWFPLETQIFPLCHSRDTLMISHLSHYHFPLMTVVFMSVWNWDDHSGLPIPSSPMPSWIKTLKHYFKITQSSKLLLYITY